MVAIEVAPDRRDLWAAIGHQCCQTGESALLKKIDIFFGDDIRHKALLAVIRQEHYRWELAGEDLVIL
jgi:hypothetical protein